MQRESLRNLDPDDLSMELLAWESLILGVFSDYPIYIFQDFNANLNFTLKILKFTVIS